MQDVSIKLKFLMLMTLVMLLFSCNNYLAPQDNQIEEIKNILSSKKFEELTFSYDNYQPTSKNNAGSYVLTANYESLKIVLNLDSVRYTTNTVIDIPYEIKKDNIVVDSGTVQISPDMGKRGSILLSFDDNYWKSWRDALDYFIDHKINATFFCTGSGHATLINFCWEVQNRGLEVAYHSLHHKNLQDSCDNEEDVFVEAVEPLNVFRRKYIYFNSFAFPNGCYQPYMVTYLKKYYKIIRGFDRVFKTYNIEDICEARFLISQSIDSNLFIDDENFKNIMFRRLLLTKLTNTLYPCTTHMIGDKKDGYNISVDNLLWLMNTINYLNIESLRYSDLYYKIMNY